MATVKPVTPADVHVHKAGITPDGVMEAWNQTIAKNFDGNFSRFTQKELIDSILNNMAGTTRSGIYAKGWLDLEPIFEKAGWSVNYDKPGHNEDYEANFTFTPASPKGLGGA